MTRLNNLTDFGMELLQKVLTELRLLKFRQYILEHVRQTRRPLNRENARKYWMGILQQEIAEQDNF